MSKRFGKVDFDLIEKHPELTVEAAWIYTCLTFYADKNREAYPTVKTLIKLSRMSKTRFYKNMDLLEMEGIVKKVPLKKGNLNCGVIYKLQDFRDSSK